MTSPTRDDIPELEIARRARQLVDKRGREVNSIYTNKKSARDIRIDGYYIRVRVDDELYVNDLRDRLGQTVFSQDSVYDPPMCRPEHLDRLLAALREATVLDELAES